MARVPKDLYLISADGKELYILAKYSGIHMLVILCDGLTLTFPDRRKGAKPYLKVADVIEWHRKELQDSQGRSGRHNVMEELTQVLDEFKVYGGPKALATKGATP